MGRRSPRTMRGTSLRSRRSSQAGAIMSRASSRRALGAGAPSGPGCAESTFAASTAPRLARAIGIRQSPAGSLRSRLSSARRTSVSASAAEAASCSSSARCVSMMPRNSSCPATRISSVLSAAVLSRDARASATASSSGRASSAGISINIEASMHSAVVSPSGSGSARLRAMTTPSRAMSAPADAQPSQKSSRAYASVSEPCCGSSGASGARRARRMSSARARASSQRPCMAITVISAFRMRSSPPVSPGSFAP
jgi:hypothetical protein